MSSCRPLTHNTVGIWSIENEKMTWPCSLNQQERDREREERETYDLWKRCTLDTKRRAGHATETQVVLSTYWHPVIPDDNESGRLSGLHSQFNKHVYSIMFFFYPSIATQGTAALPLSLSTQAAHIRGVHYTNDISHIACVSLGTIPLTPAFFWNLIIHCVCVIDLPAMYFPLNDKRSITVHRLSVASVYRCACWS